jgi:hypothetical protein
MNIETLEKFCSSWRTNFEKPFVYDKKTYSTDGHILLRIDRMLEGVEENPDFPYDRIKENFDGSFLNPAPLADYRTEEKTEICPECNGKGIVSTCPECAGSREVEWDSGWNYYTAECQSCEGTGTLADGDSGDECDNCDGKGVIAVRETVQIGNSTFTNLLINKLLNNLPEDLEIFPSTEKRKPALLRWNGGDGLLMPLL